MKTIRTVIEEQGIQIKSDGKHKTFLYLLDYIRNTLDIREIELDSNIRLEYLSDFYGLLKYLNCNSKLDYLNLLLNDMSSSNEYDGQSSTIIIIDETNPKINYILEKIKNT